MSYVFREAAGPIVVTNPTSNTNALFMGDEFRQDPFWQVSSGGNVYARDNYAYTNGEGSFPMADLGGMPTDAFMRSMLAPIRTMLPSINTPLPSGVSDVQLTGVWIDYATTAIHVRPEPIVAVRAGSAPARLAFHGPRPNPARGAVSLVLELPRSGQAEINLLDLAGRRVRILHRGAAGAGVLTLHWDGNDDAGHVVPAGLYFVRARAGSERAETRIVRVP